MTSTPRSVNGEDGRVRRSPPSHLQFSRIILSRRGGQGAPPVDGGQNSGQCTENLHHTRRPVCLPRSSADGTVARTLNFEKRSRVAPPQPLAYAYPCAGYAIQCRPRRASRLILSASCAVVSRSPAEAASVIVDSVCVLPCRGAEGGPPPFAPCSRSVIKTLILSPFSAFPIHYHSKPRIPN